MSPRRNSSPVGYVLGGLAVVGVASVAWGLYAGREPEADAPSAASPEPEPTPQTPVKSGAGTWTLDPASADRSPEGGALCEGCDIVVITVCSLRQDHVGAYGVHPGLTPRIDALAASGVRFTKAYAASNFTLAGLTAVLTGRYGSTTGVTGWDKGLVADIPTFPEVLGHYGYNTAAFTIDAPSGFRPDYGLQRGFTRMEIIPPPRDTPDGRTGSGHPGAGGDSARPAAAWIAAQPKETPILAMFHSRSAHFPFVLEPPEPGTDPTGVLQGLWDAGKQTNNKAAMPGTAGGTAQKGVVALAGPDPLQVLIDKTGEAGVAAWRKAYANAVARMDVDVGVVLDAVKARGRPTIVMVLADHGESLNDHGELLHGDAYWDGVVRVPMILTIPGVAPQVSDALVSQVDVAPTLLSAVGALPPAGIDGTSMLPLLQGETEIRATTLIEGGVAWKDSTVPRGAVIAPPWALLRQDRGCGPGQGHSAPRKPGEPASCLYDLASDPAEEHDVADAHPDVVQDLLGRWNDFRAARANEGATLKLDPAYVEELHRTGYDFRVPTGAGK